jgi:DNA polymerase III epsilon subunit family exonuclease
MRWDRFCVIDVETTGFSPASDRIVEIGCAEVDGDQVVSRWSTLVNPGRPIPSEATAIHGISDAMVAGAPSLKRALKQARRLCRGRVVAAHSARFDLSFVGPAVADKALCTLRLARLVFPEAPNHRNQTLRRFLDIDGRAGETFASHRALSDALVTAHILIACRSRFTSFGTKTSWKRFLRENAVVVRCTRG